MSVKTFSLGLMLICLAACVSEETRTGLGTPAPNLDEAAKANTSLAIEYAMQGKNDLALEKISRALEQNSDYQPAQAAAALIHARRGDNEEATRYFKRALSLNPSDVSTRNNYGVFLCDQGKTESAMELLTAAAGDRNYEGAAKAWTDAGICLRRTGDFNASADYFRRALELEPEQPEALLQMAAVSAQGKDWLRVRAFLQRRERVAKPNAECLKLAIQSERELGDAAAAETYRQKLLRNFPESRDPG